VLLTRSPLEYLPKEAFPLDLHVLGTPPAFVLSQDQTLREEALVAGSPGPKPGGAYRPREVGPCGLTGRVASYGGSLARILPVAGVSASRVALIPRGTRSTGSKNSTVDRFRSRSSGTIPLLLSFQRPGTRNSGADDEP
jgi:hypothetical protein